MQSRLSWSSWLLAVGTTVAIACSEEPSNPSGPAGPGSGAGASAGPGSGSGAGAAGPSSGPGASGGMGSGGAGAAGGGPSGGAGPGGGANCDPPNAGPLPAMKLTPVLTGLQSPVFVGQAPGDAARMYVAQRDGVIRIAKGGVVVAEPFLDLSALVSTCCAEDDRGFIAMTFHPGYAQNGRFYVSYTKLGSPGDNTTVLAEYARSQNDPDKADAAPKKLLLEIDQDYAWHYGGTIAFGNDGYLYVSRGDGGELYDPEDNGQNPNVKLGKMLRLDVDAHPTPPPGNLPGGDPHVWAYGLRNPWRWSFDRCTFEIFLGDVGRGDREEVDWFAAGVGHQNFGWDLFEGTLCFESSCVDDGLSMPLAEYDHNEGCAIIGGHVYRGSALPELRGAYLYGDLCSERIWWLRASNGAVTASGELTDDLSSPTVLGDYSFVSFGEDLTGELYLVDMVGTVFRLDPE